jgi:hypothetical protein
MARPLPSVLRSEQSTRVGSLKLGTAVVKDFNYAALLVSHGHRKQGGFYRDGGPFFVEKAENRHHGTLEMSFAKYFTTDYGAIRYRGVIPLASRQPWVYGSGYRVSDAVSALQGLQGANYTKGILATRPDLNVKVPLRGSLKEVEHADRVGVGIGQFLAELHDLPKVPGRALLDSVRGYPLREIAERARQTAFSFLGASSDELLNWEFGWRPFLQDLRALRKLTWNLDRALQKLAGENRRNLRRRATLETTTNTTGSTWSGAIPVAYVGGGDVPAGCSGETYISTSTTTTSETWFVAGYRYWIENTSSWLWKGRAAAALYGVLPTPGLIYSITPWTWLADYFSDLGSLAGYLSAGAVDSLVTRYAFTMRHTKRVEEWYATTRVDPASTSSRSWPGCSGTLRSVYTTETKQRGWGWAPFGTNQSLPAASLSPKQRLILAALATSRAFP